MKKINNFKKEIKKQETKCPKCGHVLKTQSKLIQVTCSSCGKKFNRKENLIKK
jgi:predicted  nucleic acid-binding Zn-ribbon protein